MVGYTTKVALLGLVLVLFRDAAWLSPMAFAVTAIAVSLVSAPSVRSSPSPGSARYIYDLPDAPGTQR